MQKLYSFLLIFLYTYPLLSPYQLLLLLLSVSHNYLAILEHNECESGSRETFGDQIVGDEEYAPEYIVTVLHLDHWLPPSTAQVEVDRTCQHVTRYEDHAEEEGETTVLVVKEDDTFYVEEEGTHKKERDYDLKNGNEVKDTIEILYTG